MLTETNIENLGRDFLKKIFFYIIISYFVEDSKYFDKIYKNICNLKLIRIILLQTFISHCFTIARVLRYQDCVSNL